VNQNLNTKRAIILGGGISGLAAAHALVEKSRHETYALEVLLLEASNRLGGVIQTLQREGFLLEAGPDAFISEKPEAETLARRIGLAGELIGTNDAHRRSFIVRGGRLKPVPEGFQLLAPSRILPFITSDIFSLKGKARMAFDLVLPRRADNEDESLASFVRRRLGREALERMAQPMVGGIYTADPEKLSLRATMPRFLEMERTHGSLIRAMWKARRQNGKNINSYQNPSASNSDEKSFAANTDQGTSGARYGLFLSFKQGMQTLTDRLADLMPKNSICTNARAASIVFDDELKIWKIVLENGETLRADAVCLALPAYQAAQLLRSLDEKLADELDAIPYASTATINLAYRRADIPHALDGFGFVVPFIERRSTLACSFSSVKFPHRAPENCALLRAFVGGALQPEMFALDEGEITKRVREDLRALLGIEREPLFSIVQKWARSMAQYHVGHIARVERIRARLQKFPTLRLAGNFLDGAGLPDCIRNGERAAVEMLEKLSGT
jgi:oxygen-dependent protoporphyrinogen oxidase